MLLSSKEFNFSKENQFSQWYNHIIYASDMVDARYNVQGFLVHKPWATRIIRSLYGLFEGALEKDGHSPVIFPTVIPKENFDIEKEHVEGFVPQVFWITKGGDETLARPLALRPTSETAFYQMYALWVRSSSDLPLKLYQSCSVFRYEHETLPFLRGREFLWIETHDAFESEVQARAQVSADVKIGRAILQDELGIPVTSFKRPAWDTFPGALETYAYDVLMPDGKVNQVGSTHLLGQNFSKAFGIKWKGEDGADKFAWQTCFGPGIWRMVGALVSVHGDDKGLILPFVTSPVQVIIVPILKTPEKKESVLDYCNQLEADFAKAGIRALVDSSDKTPGFKFNNWEMKGVPVRAEVGEREAASNNVTLVRRDNREKSLVERAAAPAKARELGSLMLDSMRAKAQASLASRIKNASTVDSVKEILNAPNGGFARVPFCSTGPDGDACGKQLQTMTEGGKVRGARVDEDEKPPSGAGCIVCGKPATLIAYVARQY